MSKVFFYPLFETALLQHIATNAGRVIESKGGLDQGPGQAKEGLWCLETGVTPGPHQVAEHVQVGIDTLFLFYWLALGYT